MAAAAVIGSVTVIGTMHTIRVTAAVYLSVLAVELPAGEL